MTVPALARLLGRAQSSVSKRMVFLAKLDAQESSPPAAVVQPFRPDFMAGKASSYAGFESRRSMRPGAEDHRQHPSLINGERVWLDGRRERVC